MSKVTKALETIRDACDKAMYCDMCELKYIGEEGQIGCRLVAWIDDTMPPKDWPVEDVRRVNY